MKLKLELSRGKIQNASPNRNVLRADLQQLKLSSERGCRPIAEVGSR